MDTLGKRIKARREQLHMTQDDLANAIGLDSASKRTAISRLELNDRRVYSDILPAYAAALKTNVYYLLGLSSNAEFTDEELSKAMDLAAKDNKETSKEEKQARVERLFAALVASRFNR